MFQEEKTRSRSSAGSRSNSFARAMAWVRSGRSVARVSLVWDCTAKGGRSMDPAARRLNNMRSRTAPRASEAMQPAPSGERSQ